MKGPKVEQNIGHIANIYVETNHLYLFLLKRSDGFYVPAEILGDNADRASIANTPYATGILSQIPDPMTVPRLSDGGSLPRLCLCSHRSAAGFETHAG